MVVDFFAVVTFFVVEGFFAAEDCFATAVDLCFAFFDFFPGGALDGALDGAEPGFALATATTGGGAGGAASAGTDSATGSASAADPEPGFAGSGATVLGGAGADAIGAAATSAFGVGVRGACAEVASLIATAAPTKPIAASAPHLRRSRPRRNAGCIVGITGTSASRVGGGVSPTSAMTNRLLSLERPARGTAFGVSSPITYARGERSG